MMRRTSSGFTLIETVVAVGIMGLVVLAITTLMVGVMTSQRRNRAMAEVESQGTYALYQFAQSARNATTISYPATSTTATYLKMVSAVTTENPTSFGLSGTSVEEKRGTAASSTLTTSAVTVTSLSFQNVSAAGTKGAVRMTLTLKYLNPSNKQELAFTQTFYTTVTLR